MAVENADGEKLLSNQSFTGTCGGNTSSCCLNMTLISLDSGLVYTVFMGIFMVLAFSVNLIILVAVFFMKRSHSVQKVFVASLALSDMFLAIIADIHVSTNIETFKMDREKFIVQRIFVFIICFSLICNHMNHLMIALERWLYIIWPFIHQRIVTNRVIAGCVALSWLLPCLSSCGLLIAHCGIDIPMVRLQFSVIISSYHFILSTAQLVVYGHITVVTRRQHRRISAARRFWKSSDMKQDDIVSVSRATWKQVRMSVIVFVLYFLFETPWVCTNIHAFTDESLGFYNTAIMKAAILLSLFQCYSNFIAYTLLDKDFRQILKRWFLRKNVICNRQVRPINPAG